MVSGSLVLLLSAGLSLPESPSQHELDLTCLVNTLALHCPPKEVSVERCVLGLCSKQKAGAASWKKKAASWKSRCSKK